MKVKAIGDPMPKYNFEKANRSNIVMETEMRLRHLGRGMEWLMFNGHSPLLFVLRWAAKIYYDMWYKFVGIKNVEKMMHTNYGKMWKDNYLS